MPDFPNVKHAGLLTCSLYSFTSTSSAATSLLMFRGDHSRADSRLGIESIQIATNLDLYRSDRNYRMKLMIEIRHNLLLQVGGVTGVR